ncbi:MAG: hypothetical protein D6824_09460 [Planctomycetota bacterium]|nr:MAG: hypothetical protein D6824_09460 [Planctomycetota bacterium]
MARAGSKDDASRGASPWVRQAAMWAALGALGVMMTAPVRQASLLTSSSALAAQPASPRGGIFNPTDQRRQIIDELRTLNAAVAKLQEQLSSKGVNVRVTELPADAFAQRNGEQEP